MPEVFVVVRDPDGVLPDERFRVTVSRLPGRAWWLNLEGGGVAEVREVRMISGDRVAFADRRDGAIPTAARTVSDAFGYG